MKLIAFQRRKTLHLRRQRCNTEKSKNPTKIPPPLFTENNDRIIEIRYRGDKSCTVEAGLDMRKKCFYGAVAILHDRPLPKY